VTAATLAKEASVVVAAVPCLAPSIPTPDNVVAMVVGRLAPSGEFIRAAASDPSPAAFDVAQAAAAACAAKE